MESKILDRLDGISCEFVHDLCFGGTIVHF